MLGAPIPSDHTLNPAEISWFEGWSGVNERSWGSRRRGILRLGVLEPKILALVCPFMISNFRLRRATCSSCELPGSREHGRCRRHSAACPLLTASPLSSSVTRRPPRSPRVAQCMSRSVRTTARGLAAPSGKYAMRMPPRAAVAVPIGTGSSSSSRSRASARSQQKAKNKAAAGISG